MNSKDQEALIGVGFDQFAALSQPTRDAIKKAQDHAYLIGYKRGQSDAGLAPPPSPLTSESMNVAINEAWRIWRNTGRDDLVFLIVRAVERAHGIGGATGFAQQQHCGSLNAVPPGELLGKA